MPPRRGEVSRIRAGTPDRALPGLAPDTHQLAGTLAAQSRLLNQYVWRCFSQSLFLPIQSLK